jgi:flagellar biosynthesis protein FlhB
VSEAADNDQKTEDATPKRREDAARDGDILQSRELATALVMAAGIGWLMIAGGELYRACLNLLRDGLTLHTAEIRNFDPTVATTGLGKHFAAPMAGFLFVSLMGAIAGPALLGSAGFRGKAMAFKTSRIDPLAGLKRIFGTHGLIELVKAIAKTAVLGGLGWWLIKSSLPIIMNLGRNGPAMAAQQIGELLGVALGWLALGLFAIAAVDVPAQLFQRNRKLRMTKQEVRDEHKQTEGSSEVKQALRQRQYAMLTNSARTAIAEATVVLTNPTHFAVALRYLPGKDAAPVVVARGEGELALAIKQLSAENAVPMLEYPTLARAIYFTSQTGKTVSEELYIAVATILAFVFNLDRAMADRVTNPPVTVPKGFLFNEHGQREKG